MATQDHQMGVMNRPFGAVDVAANLKGAVPKATTQKILVALAEKGEIVQKTYGKTSFFVANQASIDTVPADKLTELEFECKTIKAITTELEAQIASTAKGIVQLTDRLVPLRSGAPFVSAEELIKIDLASGLVSPKKGLHDLATGSLPPQEAEMLLEDLGIEFDTTEHKTLEKGPLCAVHGSLKRKRE
ncbi:hypothetical protein BDR05DRAFT_978866 [Suillus weaverae]|nr:hypothetical protein BDR05DRAFT_978866 [Suillus weaverae]